MAKKDKKVQQPDDYVTSQRQALINAAQLTIDANPGQDYDKTPIVLMQFENGVMVVLQHKRKVITAVPIAISHAPAIVDTLVGILISVGAIPQEVLDRARKAAEADDDTPAEDNPQPVPA